MSLDGRFLRPFREGVTNEHLYWEESSSSEDDNDSESAASTSDESTGSDSTGGSSGGETSLNEEHSYDFFEEPSRDLFCPVKLDVMLRPCQTRCCGNHVSLSAARRLKRMRKRCPLCKRTPLRFVEDKYFQRVVLGKKVYCSKRALGCTWVGEIRVLKDHLSTETGPGNRCGFVQLTCSHNCGCRFPRREMGSHESNDCPKRPFSCPHCGYTSTYETVTREHWPMCGKFPLVCPNECTDGSIERRSLKRHLSQECPEQEVDCEFSYTGCTARVKRRRLTEHIKENIQDHLRSLAKYTMQLHTHASGTLSQSWEITFRNFRWHRRSNREWYSPPFYTGVGGYKMCLGIDANGFKPNPSAHLGVALYMMRGEFDDALQWPFSGTIKLELVDQSPAGKNYSFTIVDETSHTDEDYEDIFSRVTEGERSEEGWGFTELISHKHLLKGRRGRQYMNNDSLAFRVSKIRVSSS
ncbi:TNF receptor-associated factor 4 [Geodia barretti]|uniref:TNF receptor-associated factor 4 n=1 Tax=Geodia barretti TaxID=519541 RepID=A0AA35RZ47_GEOBA|nr:TNF receptor-associated factor 4 [Geodia barretti]